MTSGCEILLQSLVQAWNRRDAAAFAGHFAPDADYVSGAGEWLMGREAIGRLVLDAPASAEVTIYGDIAFREHGPVVTAIFRWGGIEESGIAPGGVVTCVLIRGEAGWLIERLQNSDIAPEE
jgi:uncharacterized protein (TIGR02246 family)